ncbi:MAG: Rad52/Rad22 family DNA repair protein [Thermoplasmata archaeon]
MINNDKTDIVKKDENKPVEFGYNLSFYKGLKEKTPKQYIKQRPGRGGKTFDYVEVGYITDFLNKKFNCMWSFEVIDKQIGHEKVYVLGRLTIYVPTPFVIQEIKKEQFGGADIKKDSKTGKVIDIGDDLKAAASDSLKKCASMLGIASDVYWKNLDENI